MSNSGRIAHITGCGRSGTTILGDILATHPDVAFLNDRADLWVEWFPAADIWGRRTDSADGAARIALGAEDCEPEAAAGFKRRLEELRGDKPLLVEKLPINNFRLSFLFALSPAADLISIVRHGIEVAYSIAAKAARDGWYGAEDRKWRLLVDYAVRRGHGPLVALCTTPFLRGLLEWRLSVEAAEAFLSGHAGRVLHLRYEDLIVDPAAVTRRTVAFLDLPPSVETERLASERIRRFAPPAGERATPAGSEELAGDTLRRLGYWSGGERQGVPR